jgi:hypothetical protein
MLLCLAVRLNAENVHRYRKDFSIAIDRVPFSRFGSYLTLQHMGAAAGRAEGLYLRSMMGSLQEREVFRLELLSGKTPVAFREEAQPTLLRLTSGHGWVELCMPEPSRIAIRGKSAGLRLTSKKGDLTFAYAAGGGAWEINAVRQRTKFRVSAAKGGVRAASEPEPKVDLLPDRGGDLDASIWNYDRVWVPQLAPPDFAKSLRDVGHEYNSWLLSMPTVPEEFGKGADLAAYVNWESVVSPKGFLTRPAMLMSKNLMTNVWSWDNCFNAMALWERNPSLAWSQLALVLDNQSPEGIFPDHINDIDTTWGFTKPPIYGWCYMWLVRHQYRLEPKQLAALYDALARCTQWWFTYRDSDGDGLPEYNHGNDSGWDNSTVFQAGVPLETPELAAYLSIQMEALASMAGELSRPAEAAAWKDRSAQLRDKMLRTQWSGGRFVALHAGDHSIAPSGSLLLYMPLVLGARLPESVRSQMVRDLKRHYLTDAGLATEPVDSPAYERDGYWRGPVWAPSTMLIVDGLENMGEKELAQEIRRRFCSIVSRNGMYENFDAQTGRGLRDPAYTWTSSVFLIFAHELLTDQPN